MELWTGERRVASANIGPAAGDRLLGTVRGPGVYLFVGPNTSGKTTELELMLRLQDERLLRGFANVTDGASHAYLELEPARVTFRRSPSGIVSHEATGLEQLERIDAMPAAIESLIHGDHVKDPAARARHRLAALLAYAPVESSPERLAELFGTLDGRSWSDLDEDDGLRRVWRELAEAATAGRRHRLEPLRSTDEVSHFVAAHPNRTGQVLDDHERLVDLLNAMANTGEKAAEQQRRKVAGVEGRLREALEQAGRQLVEGWDATDELAVAELRAVLERSYDVVDLTERRNLARSRAEAKRASQAARIAAEARSARLAAERGGRPAVEESEVRLASAEATLAQEVASHRSATAREAELQHAVEQARATEQEADQQVLTAWGEIEDFVVQLRRRAFHHSPEGEATPRYRTDLTGADEQAARIVRALSRTLYGDPATSRAEAEQALTLATAAREAADRRLAKAEEDRDTAQAAANAARAAAETWDRVGQQLAEPAEGATDAEVEEATAALVEAERALLTATAAASYQQLAAEHVAALALAGRVDEAAKDYRAAATDSWSFLGMLLTEALRLPWLQVDGLDLYVGYVDGRLNNDPELIAAAQAAAEQAAAALDHTSAVALPRFILERIREVSSVEWRKLDDDQRVSTAELHEACLALMIERRSALGGIVVVPWQITAALDEERLLRFDAMVADAGLVVFGERPRRKGDPHGLFLERVRDRAEVAIADDGAEPEELDTEIHVPLVGAGLLIDEPVDPIDEPASGEEVPGA